jgi:hypothetical protein
VAGEGRCGPGKQVAGVSWHGGVDRIGLQGRGTDGGCCRRGGLDQRSHDAAAAVRTTYVKAGDRPHRQVIHRRFEQIWPEHADGIGRYFVEPLAGRDLDELGRILDTLIQANEDQPG